MFETYPDGTYNKRPLPPGRIPNVEPVFDVTGVPPTPKLVGYVIVPLYESIATNGPIAQTA